MLLRFLLTNIYIILTFVFLIYIYIYKCKFNKKDLDKFLYIEYDNNDIINKVSYYLSHTLYYFILGIFFGIRNIYIMIIKIVVFDIALIIMKYCNIKYLKDNEKIIIHSLILSITISILFFYIGTFFSNYFYKNILNIQYLLKKYKFLKFKA